MGNRKPGVKRADSPKPEIGYRPRTRPQNNPADPGAAGGAEKNKPDKAKPPMLTGNLTSLPNPETTPSQSSLSKCSTWTKRLPHITEDIDKWRNFITASLTKPEIEDLPEFDEPPHHWACLHDSSKCGEPFHPRHKHFPNHDLLITTLATLRNHHVKLMAKIVRRNMDKGKDFASGHPLSKLDKELMHLEKMRQVIEAREEEYKTYLGTGWKPPLWVTECGGGTLVGDTQQWYPQIWHAYICRCTIQGPKEAPETVAAYDDSWWGTRPLGAECRLCGIGSKHIQLMVRTMEAIWARDNPGVLPKLIIKNLETRAPRGA